MSVSSLPASITVQNVLYRNYDFLQLGLDVIGQLRSSPDPNGPFDPGYRLPARSDGLERLFAPSRMTLAPIGDYRGRRLTLLDLMGNERTRTTKTFASLVIVARLVRHIQDTGEPAVIVTPSSGNKATALRDAVLRAIEAGLVSAEQLRIVTVVPEEARAKLWASPIDASPALRRRNPVVTYAGAERADVKAVAQAAVESSAEALRGSAGANVWFTLSLDNYRAGDIVRAAFEHEIMPPGLNGRLHVHAVSSAYGLLGHDLGCQLLATSTAGPPPPARYFLVQHLETPDMVLGLLFGTPSRDNLPAYRRDEASGLYRQSADPRFPSATFDVDECLDSTFYTRQPVTSERMNEIIRQQGGGGIVVSLYECLTRYSEIGTLLDRTGIDLPRDPRRLREWSLVMAMTGVLNAIDRGLVDDEDILVHGSGSYSDEDFEPIPRDALVPVADAAALRDVITMSVPDVDLVT